MRDTSLRTAWRAIGKTRQQVGKALRAHPFLWLLMAVTLFNGVLWSATIPYLQAPDEPSHFNLVQFIAETGRLPVAGERYMSDELVTSMRLAEIWQVAFHPDRQPTFSVGSTGPNEREIAEIDPVLRRTFALERTATANFVPPLYHAIATTGYRLFYHQDILSRLLATRAVSVLLATLLTGVAYLLAREVSPDTPEMWITVPVVVSFQPMVTFLGAVVNSDILLFLLYGLVTWLIVRALRGMGWWHAIALGVTVGLGLLVKPMILTCGLGIAVLLAVELAQRPGERLKLLGMGGVVVGLMLAVSGWYMIHNYHLQGSFLYSNPLVSSNRIQGNLNPQPDLTILDYWSNSYFSYLRTFTFHSYWGYFGWADTPMPGEVYQALWAVCGLAAVGLALGAVAALRRRPVPWRRLLIFAILALLAISLLPPVFARGYWIARATGFSDTSIQGRYQLGAWLAQATLLTYGITRLAPRRLRPLAHATVRLAAIALNVYALVAVVLPRYYL